MEYVRCLYESFAMPDIEGLFGFCWRRETLAQKQLEALKVQTSGSGELEKSRRILDYDGISHFVKIFEYVAFK